LKRVILEILKHFSNFINEKVTSEKRQKGDVQEQEFKRSPKKDA